MHNTRTLKLELETYGDYCILFMSANYRAFVSDMLDHFYLVGHLH